MVMPIWDHSPFRWSTPPYVMWLLIIANFVVFFIEFGTGPGGLDHAGRIAGLIPAVFSRQIAPATGALPVPLTLITYQFLHANFWHVFGNMVFLFVFGDDIEELIGHWRFLAFYIACGVGAALAFVLSAPTAATELIGASGAVAGVIAAYLMSSPCAKVTILLGLIPLRVRAFWVIGGWAVWQIFEATSRGEGGIAYWAHVGGLATGAALFLVMRPPGVRLFECRAEPQTSRPVHGHLPPPLPPR